MTIRFVPEYLKREYCVLSFVKKCLISLALRLFLMQSVLEIWVSSRKKDIKRKPTVPNGSCRSQRIVTIFLQVSQVSIHAF
ncbi:hypothetical protein SK128_012515 [Halocaridina rubra]|uniref:Uncharacterized protein n=1 Tax=Halocaridina rubra TaxID=373956 RepID=A0AAN8XR68_HALRR